MGRQYVVYQKGERVEIIRLGYAGRGEHQAIRATMIALAEEVTGCKLKEKSCRATAAKCVVAYLRMKNSYPA